MNTQNKLNFITNKINQLQTALLHIHSNSLLKLPSVMIETVHVDSEGYIWIAINKPLQYIHELDRNFYVGLNFYKKGESFYLNTYGWAKVVLDIEEIKQIPGHIKALQNKQMIICVKILEASYYENQPKSIQNIFQKCKQTLSELFIGNNDFYYFKPSVKKFHA